LWAARDNIRQWCRRFNRIERWPHEWQIRDEGCFACWNRAQPFSADDERQIAISLPQLIRGWRF
jgi:hypothetical protein